MAVDAANTPLATFTAQATTDEPKAGERVWALLADRQALRTAEGVWFEPEPGEIVKGGTLGTWLGPVANTSDPDLYVSQRYGTFAYALPVANGRYQVRVYLAEAASNRQAAERRFDIAAEGRPFAADLDLAKQPGPRTAHLVEQTVTVADGTLNLAFSPIPIPNLSAAELDIRDPDLKLLKDRNAVVNAVEVRLIEKDPGQKP